MTTTDKSTMECLADDNGQYCLTTDSWTTGQCCDINDFTSPDACALQPTEVNTGFCARKTTITNKFLREFLIPADATYCPGDDNQKQVILSSHTGATDSDYLQQNHPFNLEVPTTAAAAWHCKYHITSEEAIATADVDSIGYTYLETE